jgi:hypothetical protein
MNLLEMILPTKVIHTKLLPSNQQRKACHKEKHFLLTQYYFCFFLVATASSQMKEKSTDYHQSKQTTCFP